MTWRLPPDVHDDFRWQAVLLIEDAEHVAVVIAGDGGDPSEELHRLVDTVVADRVRLGLREAGCPADQLDAETHGLLEAAAAWIVERDAMLQPARGRA